MVGRSYSAIISFIPFCDFPTFCFLLSQSIQHLFAYLLFPSGCPACVKTFWRSGPHCLPVSTIIFDGGAVESWRRWLRRMESGPYITAEQIIIIAQKMKRESVWDWDCSCASLLFTSNTSIFCTLWNKIIRIHMFYIEHYYIIYSCDLCYISYVINSSTPFP